ncbi:cytochrome P450 6k1-like [Aricia agestis]|uniref:cytochrome P450 6k1-like n=1 Tax=Aricia agestis TaxID=91739 RepID=UPI001C2082FD|nr:cytochrome P450 6k1-like [Aricia agestis]
MLFFLLLTIIICVLVMFYIKWVKVRSYWAERGVPFDPPNPFLGSLTFLMRKNPSLWMRDIYERHRSRYVGVWLFWRPALVVNTPELARNILVRDSGNFRNKFMTASTSDPIGSLNLLLTKDPAWTGIRKRVSLAFTSSKLKSVQAVAAAKSLDLVTRIHEEGVAEISLRTMFSDYTTDVFSAASLELDSNTTLTGEGAVRDITKEIMEFSLPRGLAWCAIFFWPDMAELFRVNFLPKKSTDFLRRILRAKFKAKSVELNKDPKTVLEILMQMMRKSQDQEKAYSEDCIMAQAAALLVGGYETTSSALTYITYLLAHSPRQQEKLYQELLVAEEKHGHHNMEGVIADCQYIDCVIKEALRMFPPMAWLDRVALHDYKVDDSLTIEAGTPVYVNGVGMQVDPEFYPDPYTFDPERFTAESIPYTYMPFGDGPRICIGKRYAMITLKNAIAAIILNFEVLPCPNSPKPAEAEIQKKGLFLMPGEDLKVKFISRK